MIHNASGLETQNCNSEMKNAHKGVECHGTGALAICAEVGDGHTIVQLLHDTYGTEDGTVRLEVGPR
jgi:hypothetical protein